MRGIFSQSITIIRPKWVKSRSGGQREDWSNATEQLVERVSVQPNTQAEDHDTVGDQRDTSYRVITAPGVTPDIDGTDRIEYRSTVCLVDGEVAYWPDPRGEKFDHLEFVIRDIRGG